MLKYGKDITFNPDTLDPFNIDRQSISLIPKKSRVLEIGCATGFMSTYLIQEKKCEVVGVELGRQEAKKARKVVPYLIEGDIENPDVLNKIKKLPKFDAIYASALIEHLKDPWEALKNWKKLLKKNGFLVLTTSNIAHWSVRLKMLRGKFEYQQYGLLDNTHLRFFTTHSFRKLLKDTGYTVEYFSIDSVSGGIPKISKFLSKFFPNMFAYQMLIKARLG